MYPNTAPLPPPMPPTRRSGAAPWIIAASVLVAVAVGALGAIVIFGADSEDDSDIGAAPTSPAPAVSVIDQATATSSAQATTTVAAMLPPTVPPTIAPVTVSPQTVPPQTAPPVPMPNPLVFPYDDFRDVPELREAGVRGSGCDVEMLDGLWHGYITSVTARSMSIDRVCALVDYSQCYGPGSTACGLVVENKKSLTRDFPLSAGFSVYKAEWTYNGVGCSVYVPSTLQASYAEAVWIQISGGQVQWVLRPCG